MTLKPIPGAPIDAPIPDFPTGEPGPLVLPASPFTRRPVGAAPLSATPSAPSPTVSAGRRPGTVEIRGDGNSTLTFRCIPEVPAINRSSMTISITGGPPGEQSAQRMPKLDLPIDEAKAFLLALRNGDSPVVIADSRTTFQLEFVIVDDEATFTIGQPGQVRTSRRFNAGLNYDVKTMAMHLLAELGP